MNTYINMGLDFIDHEGVRLTSAKMVNRDTGTTIAICDWKDEEVTRLLTIDGIDHNAFLKEARTLRENSIPQRFTKTQLP